MAKVKKKSVKELNAEFELLEERVMKLEVIIASQVLTASVDPGKVQEKLNGIEEALKGYDKKIGELDRELLQARQKGKGFQKDRWRYLRQNSESEAQSEGTHKIDASQNLRMRDV